MSRNHTREGSTRRRPRERGNTSDLAEKSNDHTRRRSVTPTPAHRARRRPQSATDQILNSLKNAERTGRGSMTGAVNIPTDVTRRTEVTDRLPSSRPRRRRRSLATHSADQSLGGSLGRRASSVAAPTRATPDTRGTDRSPSPCPYSKSCQRSRGRSPTRRDTSQRPGKPANRRVRSLRRSLSRTRLLFGGEEAERSKSVNPVDPDRTRSIVYYYWMLKEAAIDVRLQALEHGRWGSKCAIHLLVNVSISRGKAKIHDATFTLSFRSGNKHLKVLGFSPLQHLDDGQPVQNESEATGGLGFSLGVNSNTAHGDRAGRRTRVWTQIDQYKLESNNAGDYLLTTRLWRTGKQVDPPSEFNIQAVVECPRGGGLDVLGDIKLMELRECTEGRRKKVVLDRLAPVETDYKKWGDKQWMEKAGGGNT